MMIRTLGLSQTGTDSARLRSNATECPRLQLAADCLEKCKSSILSKFSQGAAARTACEGVDENYARLEGREDEPALHAPTVALGMFERALHLFAKDFGENRAAHGASAGLRDVRCAIAAGEDAQERLLDPVGFEREPKSVAEHHRGAENRADGIGGVGSDEGRRRTMNGVKQRRG